MSWAALRYRHVGALDEGVEVFDDLLGARRCVIKRAAGDRRGALEREHERLSELRHPAYRALLGASRDPDPMLVLEHIEGEAPDRWSKKQPTEARRLAIELLRALLHLHERGRVHGDLKPANLVIDGEGRLRVIDLGLAVQIGARIAGGTHGFVAPEHRRGAPASVAGDLYAFGETLRSLGGEVQPDLAALVRAACASDPLARPASCAAALAQLGELALPEDRVGALPLALDAAIVEELDRAMLRADGSTYVLHGPAGAGHTRVLDDLARRSTQRFRFVGDSSFARGALERLVAMLDPEGRDSLADRSMRAAVRAARLEVPLIFDDARACDAEQREALAAVVRGLAALGRGALILGGADDGLTARLEAEGARTIALPPLDGSGVRALLVAANARSGPALVAALRHATGGRAGRVASAAAWLARNPELADEAICDHARSIDAPDRQEIVEPHDVLDHARASIASGAARRAERILTATFPTLRADPTRHPEGASLLAHALASSGRLDEAEAIFAAIDRVEDRAAHARVLERLGRYEDALAIVDGADPELAAIGASAALALGRLEDARAILDRGLDHANEPAARARLLLLRSDVALRAGRVHEAIGDGHAALRSASGSPRLSAEAHSRLGSALSLSGDARTARAHHAHALEAAEATGDVGALPPYVMNLATAEHALGELGSAIARYEEAARLATRLGRAAMRAASLTNLAGLLVAAGARDEAAGVLRDAAEAAERSGSAIYAAQAVLIDAERLAASDPRAAIERARLARERFESAGAARQAMEARLLEAELAGGDGARAFCEETARELEEGGLGARAWLLRARLAGDPKRARIDVERAIGAARETGDRELHGRALALGAEIHRALGTGEEHARRAEAIAALEAVAVTLPPGLRDRFRSDPERARLLRPKSSSSHEPVQRLGDGGRRLLALLRRVLLEGDERRLLEAAVDEALALTRAERAFLLRRRASGEEGVLVARNLDRDTIREGRFSRSVAERVMSSGEPVRTEMASDDPALAGARSVLDLGLRSIVCVPVRAPSGVVGALYLDHRFEMARFGPEDLELVQALGDLIGLALENARLHREARERARALELANEQIRHENVLASARLERLEQRLASVGDAGEAADSGIVGRSEPLRRALGVARRVAASDLPVLIEGESGTGKELFARYVHRLSLRSDGPMLAINCGALPETLLESELFGHVRGAFTGATRDHPGLFRSADGGTVFLDEIGEMPARMQTRLLRVLQEREVRPVGADRAVRVDVRVIAATNRDLELEVEAGRFRRDLYFRLVGVRLVLPSLRERLDDLPMLAEHALERIAREPGMTRRALAARTLSRLMRHAWPGNVRELEQALRRAVLVADGDIIEPEDLALDVSLVDRRTALQRFDRALVEQALAAANGNRTEAAAALGVSRMTIHRWIKRYGLD